MSDLQFLSLEVFFPGAPLWCTPSLLSEWISHSSPIRKKYEQECYQTVLGMKCLQPKQCLLVKTHFQIDHNSKHLFFVYFTYKIHSNLLTVKGVFVPIQNQCRILNIYHLCDNQE